jgi:hypothetical protein
VRFLLLLALCLLAARAQAFSSAPYLPLPDGATWTYAVGSGGTEVRTITGTTTVNGAQVKVMRDQAGNETYLTNDASGVRLHGGLFVDPPAETDTYAPPATILLPDATIGTPVSTSGLVSLFVEGEGTFGVNYSSVSTALAIESTTVPAGTFPNALHVRQRIDVSFGDESFHQIHDAWLVQGIGIVRESLFDSFEGTTETWQLQSHNVPDTIPDAFSFAPKTVDLAFQSVVSDPITVGGLGPAALAEISITGGAYQVNAGPFVTEPGTVGNGDQVTLQVLSAQPGFAASATLDIGGVTASFVVTTSADTSPDAFGFTPVVGAPLGITLHSNPVTITGLNAAAPISIVGGEYSVSGQAYTSAPGTIDAFYSVEVRVATAPTQGATTSATLTIGGVSATFSATTFTGAQGAGSVLFYASPPGDYIGNGRTRVINFGTAYPGSTLDVARILQGGITASITEDGGGWNLDLDAPGSGALVAGRYEGAVRYPFHDDGAGLSFAGGGRGCNTLTGRFDVLEVGYAADGSVQRLAANFEQSCEGFMPPLLGEFRFNSSVPLGSTALKRVAADFNGDTRSDILWRNAATGENYLYPMDGAAILGSEGYLRTVADLDWGVAGIGDFDGDGKADIVWRNSSTGENYVYLMDGTAIKPGEGYIRTVADANWQVAGVGDFDGDGKDDILWRNAVTGENYLYPMDGLTIKPGEGYLRTVADLGWKVVGVGDLDGDGKADVLWRNSSTGQNYLYPMDGTSIKPSEGFLRTVADANWQVAGLGDYDGDAKVDVLWRNQATGENYLYPMDGPTIKPSEGYLRTVADTSWQVKGTGDYDGDGKADVLWRHAVTGENYLYPMEGITIKPGEGYLRSVPQPYWQIQNPKQPMLPPS